MVIVLAFLALIGCAAMAVRATRLLHAVLWLAATSVFLALAIYQFGAPELAVIELSVGAGLIAVLFVFTIAIAGDDGMRAHGPVPSWLLWALSLPAVLLLAGLTLPLPLPAPSAAGSVASFRQVLWDQRPLDLLGQLALVFIGALGVLILAVEPRPGPSHRPTSATPSDTNAHEASEREGALA